MKEGDRATVLGETGGRSRWAFLRSRGFRIWLALGVLFVVDLNRAPERQWTARVILAGIDAYQARVSERLGAAGVHCRFEPTCSHYAEAVILDEGALVGGARALGRLVRCGPWTPDGTSDPP